METETQVKRYRELFDSVANPQNWKLPTKEFLTFDRKEAEEMKDAIVFFVGGASVSPVDVPVHHPEGLVTFLQRGYLVTSQGYYVYVGA